jgi:antitoxin component YwqK of YwqJK toxin-antitoxin module
MALVMNAAGLHSQPDTLYAEQPVDIHRIVTDINGYIYFTWTRHYKNGRLAIKNVDSCKKEKYLDERHNDLEGYEREYYENGVLKQYRLFNRNEQDRSVEFYDEKGILTESYESEKGKLLCRKTFNNGRLSYYTKALLSDTAVSVTEGYYPDGKISVRDIALPGKDNRRLYNWDTLGLLTRYFYRNDRLPPSCKIPVEIEKLYDSTGAVIVSRETFVTKDTTIVISNSFYTNHVMYVHQKTTKILPFKMPAFTSFGTTIVEGEKYEPTGELGVKVRYVLVRGSVPIKEGYRDAYYKGKVYQHDDLEGFTFFKGDDLFWVDDDFTID